MASVVFELIVTNVTDVTNDREVVGGPKHDQKPALVTALRERVVSLGPYFESLLSGRMADGIFSGIEIQLDTRAEADAFTLLVTRYCKTDFDASSLPRNVPELIQLWVVADRFMAETICEFIVEALMSSYKGQEDSPALLALPEQLAASKLGLHLLGQVKSKLAHTFCLGRGFDGMCLEGVLAVLGNTETPCTEACLYQAARQWWASAESVLGLGSKDAGKILELFRFRHMPAAFLVDVVKRDDTFCRPWDNNWFLVQGRVMDAFQFMARPDRPPSIPGTCTGSGAGTDAGAKYPPKRVRQTGYVPVVSATLDLPRVRGESTHSDHVLIDGYYFRIVVHYSDKGFIARLVLDVAATGLCCIAGFSLQCLTSFKRTHRGITNRSKIGKASTRSENGLWLGFSTMIGNVDESQDLLTSTMNVADGSSVEIEMDVFIQQ